MTLLLTLIALFCILALGGFGLLSLQEKEPRAARLAFALAAALTGLFLGAAFLPAFLQKALLIFTAVFAGIFLLLFLLPIGRVQRANENPAARIDERDIPFARARLSPGSENYSAYYSLRPENQPGDDETRALPGLLSHRAALADPFLFSAADASFELTGALRDAVDGPVAAQKIEISVEKSTTLMKDLARYYGALDVGIARLEPAHYYSHVGRGSGPYGEMIEANHPFAIAFTVEMDAAMIAASPFATGVMESAKQYVEAARTAVQLAAAIRGMGYEARAHIDGNYRVVAPLVARDAGLGEIGRMGLLMTPRLGPRVRLGVVTTTLPLVPDGRKPDPSVLDFCALCKKCAECCPSKSIPFGERTEIEGVLRWQINADTCFRYWNVIGTDCGRCMAVCPYAHLDHPAHNLVRWGARRSGFFRRLALPLDDLFYGKRPAPHPAPAWTAIGRDAKKSNR